MEEPSHWYCNSYCSLRRSGARREVGRYGSEIRERNGHAAGDGAWLPLLSLLSVAVAVAVAGLDGDARHTVRVPVPVSYRANTSGRSPCSDVSCQSMRCDLPTNL
jgi:hypothetical protein